MNIIEEIKKLSIHDVMIASLVILAAFNIISNKYYIAIFNILLAIASTTIIDYSINRYFYKRSYFPKSATISGLFIGSILSPDTSFYFIILAAAIAMLSKHLIKLKQDHLFNPAGFGIFVLTIFGASQIWWSAQPLILVLILGLLVAWKFKRFDSQPSFLITYFIISAITLATQGNISSLYLRLTDSFLFFFTLFMLVEPMTSPITKQGRIVHGIIVGILASIFLYSYPAQFILSALLIGNVIRFVYKKKL